MSIKLTGLILIICFPCSVFADFDKHQWYAGFKLSYFEFEDIGLSEREEDDPDNVGIIVGFEKRFDYGYLGLESAFTRTFVTGNFLGEETDVDTTGLFFVYRTQAPIRLNNGPYLKLKAGLYHYNANIGNETESDLTSAIGIGFGLNMQVVRFELDIIAPEKDIGFVSIHVLF